MAVLNSDAHAPDPTHHVRQTLHDALHVVERHTGLTDEAQALTALQTVTEGLVQRLTPVAATDLISELPCALHAPLLETPAGPNKQLDLDSIRDSLAARLALAPDEASTLLPAITRALRELVTAREFRELLAQLPRDLRECLGVPASSRQGSQGAPASVRNGSDGARVHG